MGPLELSKRREEVRRLSLMGWSPDRIAENVNTPVKTIYRDIVIIQEQERRLKETNQRLIEDAARGIMEMLMKYQLVEKEAWNCYMVILEPVEKIKALRALTTVYGDIAKLLKLIDSNQINIEKYINIENLVPMLNQVIMIVDKYIPEDKKLEAFKELKQLDILKEQEK